MRCLALALVMIFVSTDHINFAQGEMAMFSAYLCWQLMQWGVSFWIALPLVALFSFLLGVAIERVILRPLHNAPVLSMVVVFIGLLAIFHSLAGAIWSHTIKDFPSPFPKVTFAGSGYIGPHQIGMIVVTLLLLLALFAFFRFTPLGLAMRAAAQNPSSARLVGIRVDWMLALGWGLAAAVGAVAGMHGGAGRLSRAQHDGEHPALRLRRRAGRRHLATRAARWSAASSSACWRTWSPIFGNLLEKATGVYIIGNGEKLTVALIIVITVLTLKPSGLFGHVTVKRV